MKKKAKIAIASVLKPVDDVRNYEKIGRSLVNAGNYEVHMIGSMGTRTTTDKQITMHEWKTFGRLKLSRLSVQWSFWKKLREIKPELIIFTTYELLLVAVIYRLVFSKKLVYDLQEDYYKNLWHQTFYPAGFRHLAALIIRAMEILTSPFVHHYLLAEKVYREDISFLRNRFTILENRSLPIGIKAKSGFKVVFTGTLTAYSRPIESIELFLKIKDVLGDAQMTVIGYAPNENYFRKLQHYGSLVELKVSQFPVSHEEITLEISQASLAIIGYEPNPVNQRKVPTKLFEYVCARLPYLVQKGTHWKKIGEELGGCIGVDFKNPDLLFIRKRLAEIELDGFSDKGFLWNEIENDLIESVSKLLEI